MNAAHLSTAAATFAPLALYMCRGDEAAHTKVPTCKRREQVAKINAYSPLQMSLCTQLQILSTM